MKPVSGTKEWASHSVNIQLGCFSDCKYCYAKSNAIRFGKATPASWACPVVNQKSVNQKRSKLNGTIMFPTAHDISPDNIADCIVVLTKLLEAGNKVLIVSKPHLECIKSLCEALIQYKDQILFRFTIGSYNDDILKFWEPNAPRFSERLTSLAYAHGAGFQTSVSCEPMLDAHVEDVIEVVRSFVTDAIWIGKPNKLMLRASMNSDGSGGKVVSCPGETVVEACEKLLAIYTDEFIWRLYHKYEDDPMIKWKDSIKQVVGLDRPTVKGMDQ